MQNLLSSPNSLMLIGVGVLAVIIIVVAIWVARVSSKANRLRGQLEMMDHRLTHVEDYLVKRSNDDFEEDEEYLEDEYEEDAAAYAPNAGAAGSSGSNKGAAAKRNTAKNRSGSGAISGIQASAAKSEVSSAAARKDRVQTSASGQTGSQKAQTKASRRSSKMPVIPRGEAHSTAVDPYGEMKCAARAAAQPRKLSKSQEVKFRREQRRQENIRRQAQNIVNKHNAGQAATPSAAAASDGVAGSASQSGSASPNNPRNSRQSAGRANQSSAGSTAAKPKTQP